VEAKVRKFLKCKREWRRRDGSGEEKRTKLMKEGDVKGRSVKYDERCARGREYQQEKIKIKTSKSK
jgi:hypothetical protein